MQARQFRIMPSMLSGRQGGGKVPLPGAHANAPSGGVRLLVQASLGWSPRPFTRRISKTTPSFTRRTISAVSAANACEGITCHWQVTRNGSDEAERSERSRARERKCSATELASATGEGGRGTCAASPGAIRRPEARCSLPSGYHACSCV